MKKIKLIVSVTMLLLFLAGCSSSKEEVVYKVSVGLSEGGVNDQSFNQSAWEGLKEFSKETGVKVKYLESKQTADYLTNLERAVDNGSNLVWAIGYTQADALLTVANANPNIQFAIADYGYEDAPFNVTAVTFRAEESSFLAGYIAGKTTKTGKVGYVGASKTFVNDQFQYGYASGVVYAAKELGKEIEVQSQITESYTDAAKAKAVANKMYSSGCDIVFHAAGAAGLGVIESAKENKKYVIGVDKDQSYLAPDYVLTSALKNVNVAVKLVSEIAKSGGKIGGQTLSYGLKENCVGIPEKNENLDPAIYENAMKIKEMIMDGSLVPASNSGQYEEFFSDLNQEGETKSESK